MKDSINILSIPSGQHLNLGTIQNISQDSESVVCVERTEFGCFHEHKAPYILDRPLSTVSSGRPCSLVPPSIDDSTATLFVFPQYELLFNDNLCSISWLVANRTSVSKDIKRFIFVGERGVPSYDLFLLYSYPLDSFIYENGSLTAVSQEAVRRLSHRFSLSELASKCTKLGCLVDSAAGVNSSIITQLYKLGSQYGFKVYPISIGKLEDYKLGNFCDIDLFVNLQCQFCFDLREKFSTPVLTYFEFVSGLFESFWDYSYGDYSALLLREQTELLNSNIAGYIDNKPSDFKSVFSCHSKPASNSDEEVVENVEITTGQFGTPMSYQNLL